MKAAVHAQCDGLTAGDRANRLGCTNRPDRALPITPTYRFGGVSLYPAATYVCWRDGSGAL